MRSSNDHSSYSHSGSLHHGTTNVLTYTLTEQTHRDWREHDTRWQRPRTARHSHRGRGLEGRGLSAKLRLKTGPVDYDLRGLTVLPGWIDAHVHITWSFGPDGKNAGQGGTSPEAAYAAASNAWRTLMAGFTTVQSVGSPADVPLGDAIAKGMLPGPRILTAIEPLMGRGEQTGTADEIRAFVRKQKAAGADLVKIYAFGGHDPGRDDDVPGAT